VKAAEEAGSAGTGGLLKAAWNWTIFAIILLFALSCVTEFAKMEQRRRDAQASAGSGGTWRWWWWW
jgi:hypothetical protein